MELLLKIIACCYDHHYSAGARIRFSQAEYSFEESEQSWSIEVVLVLEETAALERDIIVSVVNLTVDGSTNGATYLSGVMHVIIGKGNDVAIICITIDYAIDTTDITFDGGSTSGESRTKMIMVVQDGRIEPDEVFTIQLEADASITELIEPRSSIVTITSSDGKRM